MSIKWKGAWLHGSAVHQNTDSRQESSLQLKFKAIVHNVIARILVLILKTMQAEILNTWLHLSYTSGHICCFTGIYKTTYINDEWRASADSGLFVYIRKQFMDTVKQNFSPWKYF